MPKKKKAYYVSYGVLSTGLDIVKCTIVRMDGGRYDIAVGKYNHRQGADVYSTPGAMRLKVKRSHIAFTKQEAQINARNMVNAMYKGMLKDISFRMKTLESLS